MFKGWPTWFKDLIVLFERRRNGLCYMLKENSDVSSNFETLHDDILHSTHYAWMILPWRSVERMYLMCSVKREVEMNKICNWLTQWTRCVVNGHSASSSRITGWGVFQEKRLQCCVSLVYGEARAILPENRPVFEINFLIPYTKKSLRSRVSSGSIVSDYGLDDRAIGVRSLAGEKDFSSILCVQTGSGAHPASCTTGTGGPFPGVKARPGRDADHSPPSSAEVENE
jgi:hypothetical protein